MPQNQSTPPAAPNFATRDYGFQAPTGFTPPSSFGVTQDKPSGMTTTSHMESGAFDSYTQTTETAGYDNEATPHNSQQQWQSQEDGRPSLPQETTDSQQNGEEMHEFSAITVPESFTSHLQMGSTQSPDLATGSTTPNLNGSGSVNTTPERKRPTSLFERFTGVARGRATPAETKPSVSIVSTPDKNTSSEADLLEIPAFLRRDG